MPLGAAERLGGAIRSERVKRRRTAQPHNRPCGTGTALALARRQAHTVLGAVAWVLYGVRKVCGCSAVACGDRRLRNKSAARHRAARRLPLPNGAPIGDVSSRAAQDATRFQSCARVRCADGRMRFRILLTLHCAGECRDDRGDPSATQVRTGHGGLRRVCRRGLTRFAQW